MNKLHQCPNLDYPYLAIPDIDEDTLDYLNAESYNSMSKKRKELEELIICACGEIDNSKWNK